MTHIGRTSVDSDLAQRQWEAYVDVFRSRGWEIHEIAPADDQPDGVFVEDAVVVFGDLAVICRAGALSRRGEAPTVRDALATSGLETAEVEAPGTLDGGDVLKIGTTVYVGASSRTNADGIAQLTSLLAPRGWDVVAVPVEKVLHLKSGVTALPDGTVVGFEPLVDDPSVFPVFEAVPEEHGTAVVVLGPTEVLMSSDAPETAERYAARGLTVVATPITEFEKLEGCVTCLSVRIRD